MSSTFRSVSGFVAAPEQCDRCSARAASSSPCRQSSKTASRETKKKHRKKRRQGQRRKNARSGTRFPGSGWNSEQQCYADAKDNMPMRLMPTAAQKKGSRPMASLSAPGCRRALGCGNAGEQNKMRREVCAGRRGVHAGAGCCGSALLEVLLQDRPGTGMKWVQSLVVVCARQKGWERGAQ